MPYGSFALASQQGQQGLRSWIAQQIARQFGFIVMAERHTLLEITSCKSESVVFSIRKRPSNSKNDYVINYNHINGYLQVSLLNTISTIRTTNYIRGAVILYVVSSHYTQYYLPDLYKNYLTDYASMSLAIFFILSGYGLFFSLERRMEKGQPVGALLREFYFDRLFRIVIPYWLALFLLSLLPDNEILRTFDPVAIRAYLFAPAWFWFAGSILQCYLVAPLLYFYLKKKGPVVFIISLAGAFGVLYLFSFWLNAKGFLFNSVVDTYALAHHLLFLGNILLFAVGLVLPWLITKYGMYIKKLSLILLGLAVFVASMYYGRSSVTLYPFYLAGGTLFCASMIARRPWLPLERTFNYLGRSSYSIYLFHYHYYAIMIALGLIYSGSRLSVIYAMALSPVFFAFCGGMEWAMKHLHTKAKRSHFFRGWLEGSRS